MSGMLSRGQAMACKVLFMLLSFVFFVFFCFFIFFIFLHESDFGVLIRESVFVQLPAAECCARHGIENSQQCDTPDLCV